MHGADRSVAGQAKISSKEHVTGWWCAWKRMTRPVGACRNKRPCGKQFGQASTVACTCHSPVKQPASKSPCDRAGWATRCSSHWDRLRRAEAGDARVQGCTACQKQSPSPLFGTGTRPRMARLSCNAAVLLGVAAEGFESKVRLFTAGAPMEEASARTHAQVVVCRMNWLRKATGFMVVVRGLGVGESCGGLCFARQTERLHARESLAKFGTALQFRVGALGSGFLVSGGAELGNKLLISKHAGLDQRCPSRGILLEPGSTAFWSTSCQGHIMPCNPLAQDLHQPGLGRV